MVEGAYESAMDARRTLDQIKSQYPERPYEVVCVPKKYRTEQNTKAPENPKDAAHLCAKHWKETLLHFGITRPVLSHELMQIARLVSNHDYKDVIYCMVGMRFEEKTQGFDPAKNLNLYRAFDPKLFGKFINLASIRKAQQDKKRNE